MQPPELCERLQAAAAAEHAAIVQYLHAAYALEATALAPKFESLAREEMFHLKWLTEALVRLGAPPHLGRAPVRPERPATAAALLGALAADEHQAAAGYRSLAAAAGGHPWLQALLLRLAGDEERHHGALAALQAVHGAQPVPAAACAEPPTPAGACPFRHDVALLNRDVQAEYDTILEFLDRWFRTGDTGAQNLFMDQAVDSMRHLGWLSEQVAELGGLPAIDTHACDPRAQDSLVDWVAAQAAGEDAIHAMYEEHIRTLQNPEARELLETVLAQEVGHRAQLRDLLEHLRAGGGPAPDARRFTVGSLIKPQP